MITTPEAYVHLSADKTILTFYYDTLRYERNDTTWGIGGTRMYNDYLIPAWAGTFESPNTTVHTAVFDASFRDFRPTTTAGWFQFFQSLKSIEGLEHLNTSQVTSMSGMFYECESLPSLDLSNFDTSKVTDMSVMFVHCESLTPLDLSNFDTSKVTDMSWMFWSCVSLTSLDLSHFDTSEVTRMDRMFWGCVSLTSLDLSHFDTSKVESMSFMFCYCSSLTSLDISSFDTSKVTDMSGMFSGCNSLPSLDLSNFDTSKVTDMSEMFKGCESLTPLDLSNFDTSKMTDMSWMFYNCSSLTTIYCNSSWSYKLSFRMFYRCTSLKGAVEYDESKTDVDMANPETGYFTPKVLAQEDEAYVVFNWDMKRLTFYYDREREYRIGTIGSIEETMLQNDKSIPAWAVGRSGTQGGDYDNRH